jgi:hypothetical protein
MSLLWSFIGVLLFISATDMSPLRGLKSSTNIASKDWSISLIGIIKI